MDITSVASLGSIRGIGLASELIQPVAVEPARTERSFMEYLTSVLDSVDGLHKEASASAIDLVVGNEQFLHNTLMAYSRASLALQLTIEVRNRLVESYQDIMRMQMYNAL